MKVFSGILAAIFVASIAVGPAQVACAQGFGPGYDPLRPPPQEPKETGPGIVSATLIAAGDARIEEFPEYVPASPSALFVAALDVGLAAGTTTVPLHGASVQASFEEGEGDPLPVFAVCLPTADEPLSLFYRAGTKIAAWNVAIEDRIFHCGGRTARMMVEVGEGGFRLTTAAAQAWQGPVLVAFQAKGKRPRRITLPGATVEIPVPEQLAGEAN